MAGYIELSGKIASAGFASGDRFVIGCWRASPLGRFADLMWARPDGSRVLVARDRRTARCISGLYEFEAVEVAEVEVRLSRRGLVLESGPLHLELLAGPPRRIPFSRPAWFTRWVEGPVARCTMGVRTYGVTEGGVRVWYRADAWQWVAEGHARLGDLDLGPLAPLDPPVRFGFSEPPRRPSIVSVRPLVQGALVPFVS
ncbi:MAG: hypothetical protein M3N51_03515 [Actinomycetota bacterium]|nr:hypothetical protein [Actinomycetota bacterium]